MTRVIELEVLLYEITRVGRGRNLETIEAGFSEISDGESEGFVGWVVAVTQLFFAAQDGGDVAADIEPGGRGFARPVTVRAPA